MNVQPIDKLSGVTGGASWVFLQVETYHVKIDPAVAVGDLIVAVIITVLTTTIAWVFRRFVLDKIKIKN